MFLLVGLIVVLPAVVLNLFLPAWLAALLGLPLGAWLAWQAYLGLADTD
jgi:hypothetical protein